MEKKWFEKSYRRNFLDMHIPDWNDHFLEELDPDKIMETILKAHGTSLTVFSNSHSGLNFYPSSVGQMHQLVKKRDIFGELVDAGNRHGLDVLLYYCTIYVNWYGETHPDALIKDRAGYDGFIPVKNPGLPLRRGMVCPNNSGYRDFVVTQLKELCENYTFKGVWPDMTFWPTVCYCSACRDRYREEAGEEIPTIINWEDPKWVQFQRKRQEWISEFAELVTSTIRSVKPEISVAHQSHTYSDDWLFGASVDMTNTTDWLSADLYRDRADMSFLTKLFYSQSNIKPFEQVNCWYTPDIHEHVIARTEEHLRCTTFNAIMNNGAQVFIDAIDPVGTLNEDNYERAGKIYAELENYEEYAGGDYLQDIGIYYSFDSQIDLEENGRDVSEVEYNFIPGRKGVGPQSHGKSSLKMAEALLQNNIPYGVITKKNLRDLYDYQVIVLSNCVMLDEEEMNALKEYVSNGGSLFASKDTTIVSHDGKRQKNFLLADLFGVDFLGETKEIVTYVSPADSYEELFPRYSKKYPVTLNDKQQLVRPHDGTDILAYINLPYTDPREARFASHLTNPPGIDTEYPALVLNHFGKGKVLYSSGVIETWEHESQRRIIGNLIKFLSTRSFFFESSAPKPVEITMFEQKSDKRFIIHLLNFQKDLPNIPVENISLSVNIGEKKAKNVMVVPKNTNIEYKQEKDIVQFTAPKLDTYMMICISYE